MVLLVMVMPRAFTGNVFGYNSQALDLGFLIYRNFISCSFTQQHKREKQRTRINYKRTKSKFLI
jgi:hypothetical protein